MKKTLSFTVSQEEMLQLLWILKYLTYLKEHIGIK